MFNMKKTNKDDFLDFIPDLIKESHGDVTMYYDYSGKLLAVDVNGNYYIDKVTGFVSDVTFDMIKDESVVEAAAILSERGVL